MYNIPIKKRCEVRKMTRNDFLKIALGATHWKDLKVSFISEAKKVKTIEDTANFCVKWSAYLFYDSPISTIKNRSLEMRKELELNNVGDKFITAFILDSNVYRALNAKYSDEVINTLSTESSSDFDYVLFVERTISTLTAEIESGDHSLLSNNSRADREIAYKQLIVLSLSTGRRQIEILKTVSINKKKDEALYSGLAKKKKEDEASVEAPCLIDITIAKRYLKNVREVFGTETMQNKEINSKYNASINKAIQRYFPELKIDGFHFFRTAYAEYCFQKFGSGDKLVYFAKVLGHELVANSTMAYQAKGIKGGN